MGRYLALVAVLAASLAVSHAAAAKDSLLFPSRDRAYRALGAFQALCLAHRLDREGALEAAAAQGWVALPDGQMPTVGGVQEAIEGLKLTSLAARWKPSPDGDMVLLLGDGGPAGLGCAIAFHSGFRMASSVMGGSELAPLPRLEKVSPKYDLWAFVEGGDGGRQAVRSRGGKIDQELIASASAERRFATIAVIGSDADAASLYLYSIPPPLDAAR